MGRSSREGLQLLFRFTAEKPLKRLSVTAPPLCGTIAPTFDVAGTPTDSRTLKLLLVVFGLAIGLRLWNLFTVSFWFDEASSWRISQFPLNEMLNAVMRDGHPPLFYCLLKCWQSLVGSGEEQARWLGLICGLFSILAAARLAVVITKEPSRSARATDSKGTSSQRVLLPLLTAMLLTFSPLHLALSQQARPYLLCTGLSLISATSLLRAIRQPEHARHWLGFSTGSLAASFTHYYGLFAVITLFLYAAVEVLFYGEAGNRHSLRKQVSGLLFSAGVLQLCWVGWLPVFLQQQTRAHAQLWYPPLQPDDALLTIARLTLGPQEGGHILVTGIAVLIWLAVPLFVWSQWGASGRLIALCTLCPVLLASGYSAFAKNLLDVRYISFPLSTLMIGVAMILATIPRNARWIAIALVFSGSSYWTFQQLRHRSHDARHAGLRNAVQALHRERQGQEPVLFASPFVLIPALAMGESVDQFSVRYSGDHHQDLLAGPALKHSDYQQFHATLNERPDRLWTIDNRFLNGPEQNVDVPSEYRAVSQKRFEETHGMAMTIFVRCYQRDRTHAGGSAQKTGDSE